MHTEMNYVDPRKKYFLKKKKKPIRLKIPQVCPFQKFISYHDLLMFQSLAPLTLIHSSTLEEKYFKNNNLFSGSLDNT